MRREVVYVLILEDQLAFLWAIESVDAIEDAGFSSPIGSDDCQHLSLTDIKTDP
jgi:hypothetical protein